MLSKKCALWILCLLLSLPLSAQYISSEIDRSDNTQVLALRTVQGDVLIGTLQHIGLDSLTLLAQNNITITFALTEVDWLGPLPEAEPWLRSLQQADAVDPRGQENLVYSPTAFTYPRGIGEWQSTDIIYNFIDYSLSDHFSVGGGMFIPYVLMFRVRAATPITPNWRVGIGANSFLSLEPDLKGLASHFFGIFTFGPADRFLNLTIGPLTDYESSSVPWLLTLGGSTDLSEKWSIMVDVGVVLTEGFRVPSFLISYTHRSSRFAAGIIGLPDGEPVVIPLLRYALRFTGK